MIFIRGAISVSQNTKAEILVQTERMLKEIMTKNSLNITDINAIFFTATKDLDQVYPAVAARNLGMTEAALMCFQEMNVEGSLIMCIRCTVICNIDKDQKEVTPVYMDEAVLLRPDLDKQI